MRLSILDHGHRLRAKAFMRLTSGDAPDVVRLLLYRPGFLARPLLALTVPAMRGPSFWTASEREYLAASIARQHECPFCADTHTELTRLAGDVDPDDPATVRSELAAVRGFVTGGPAPADVPEHAVREALRVALVWQVVNRLANAFGFRLRGDQLHTGTRALHRFGYRFPAFLLSGGPRPTGDAVADLRRAVLTAPAITTPAQRTAAATGDDAGEPWAAYTELVRTASHRITDEHLTRLAAEHSAEVVYELTVAAAVGAALETYEAGLRS